MTDTIQFEKMLREICEAAGIQEAEKKEVEETLRELSAKKFTTLLLDAVKPTDEMKKTIATFSHDNTPDAEMTKEAQTFFNQLAASLPEQEKFDLYMEARLEIFLKLIEPIIHSASDEEKIAIGQILSADEGFYEIYKEYKNGTAKNPQ